MAPSRSKTRDKAAGGRKAGKGKAASCEKKSPPQDPVVQGVRLRKEKGNAQAVSEEPSSEKETVPVVTSEESTSKSQSEARVKGGNEGGCKKQAKGKRISKGKDNREAGSGGKRGEQLMSKEKKKARGSKEQDMKSGPGNKASFCNEVKVTEDRKKCAFKRQCREHLSVSEIATETESVKSFTVESTEGSSQKRESPQKDSRVSAGKKYNKKHDSKATTIRKLGSQFQGSLEHRSKTVKCEGDRHKQKPVRKSAGTISSASEEGKILKSSEDASCFGPGDEANYSQATRRRETGDANSQISKDQRNSLEEELSNEEKATLENWLPSEGKGCRELRNGSNKATSESEGEQETTGKRQESEDEETVSEESEADGKMKAQSKISKQRKSTLSDDSEEDENAGASEDEVKSSVMGENESDDEEQEDLLEKDNGEEMSEEEQAKSESDEDEKNGGEETDDDKLVSPRRKQLPSTVKAKLLNTGLNKVPPGNSWEGNVNEDGSTARESPAWSTQPTLKKKSQKPVTTKPGEELEHVHQGSSSSDSNRRVNSVVVLAKKCSAFTLQSQILLSLKNNPKDAQAKLWASSKESPLQKTAETSSDLEKGQKAPSKSSATKTYEAFRESSLAKDLGEPRLSLSTVSNSSSSSTKNLSVDKQHLGRRKKIGKVIGKVKLASGQSLAVKEERAEEKVVEAVPAEKEQVLQQKGIKSLHTLSAFRKVTGWLSQKPPKKVSLKDRFLSVARAVGISDWLLKTFGKRSSKPFGFRRRMTIRIVSTAGLNNRPGRTSPGPVGEHRKRELNSKSCSPPLLEWDHAGTEVAEELEEAKLASCNSPLNEASSSVQLLNLDGCAKEKNNVVNAKFAVVFPRVHCMAKSRGVSPGNSESRPQSTDVSSRKAVTSVQPGFKFKRDLPKEQACQRISCGLVHSEEINPSMPGDSSQAKCIATQYGVTRLLSSSSQVIRTSEGKDISKSQLLTKGQRGQSAHQTTKPFLFPKAAGNYQYEQSFLLHEEGSDAPMASYFAGDVDKEVANPIQRAGSEATAQLHWVQRRTLGCDPTAWLNSETLLPRLTIENLSKWAMYKHQDLVETHRPNTLRKKWEAEEVTEDILEMDVMWNRMYMGEHHLVKLEEVEDLSRLEEVCESSVLLCLKKRFHRNFIYTYIGQILISVNLFKPLGLYLEEVMTQYQQGMLSKNAPHIFAIAEMAYTLSQTSVQEQCIVISGHSGSGKTEAAKAVLQYLTTLYQRQDSPGIRQPCDVLPILESFGNAKTIHNDNSSRFGKFLHVHLRDGAAVGTSISQYLLEKSRVVFQAHGERSYHVFYELLAGLPAEQKEQLYLHEAETYFYLNQGRACDLPGKQDDRDFVVLVQALQVIGLSDDQLTSIWAVLAALLQLGNICFTSCEKESFGLAAIPSDTEIRIVANLLHVSADLLQSAVTHRVTVTSYDRIFTPLSIESAIDARDAIAKALYSLLFDWLLVEINEWLAAWQMDSTVGVVDIYGFEDLGVNSLEQLCINFANEHLQHFFSQTVVAQEEEEYIREELVWIPVSKILNESCLDLIAAKPHGILRILDDQTSLAQATDHTFLQKCHYHHGNSPWYGKPKLPSPVFTVQHYAGPVTYQVHKFLNKNHDLLRLEVLEIFSQSHLKLVSHLFQQAKEHHRQQRELAVRGKGLNHHAPTLVSRFQQSLQDLTAKLGRSHTFFIRCIAPNPKKLPDVFDVEYITCQLRHSGILEAIHIRKEGYPIRIPFQQFLVRYGALTGQGQSYTQEREGCAAVLSHVVGDSSDLYQIGVTKVFLKEKAKQLLERQWNQKQSWAVVTLQRNLRGLISRRQFQVFRQKVMVLQAHFRGHQARKRYRRLKMMLVQFGMVVLISRLLVQTRKRSQDVGLLEIPAELAALLHSAKGQHHAQTNQITEVSPPEVKARCDLSLPPDTNNSPFSTFIRSHFQEPDFPALGQPLQQPLTRLQGEDKQSALEINKLILRFTGDKNLQSWQEVLVGNYIASRGLSNLALRSEILSQVVSQLWKNPDPEQSQRGCALMAALLCAFAPSPALEKPLLRFVSDHGLEGYNAVCQRKILTAMQQTEMDPEVSRAHPPTLLEWTANQRRGKMVLDVFTYNEERFSAEVESWTTGEQYTGWILSSRGLDKDPRGWSVSLLRGEVWQDLPGCDFVLDLIGEMEKAGSPSMCSSDYPITPKWDESLSQGASLDLMDWDIPPAPGIQAPSLPPPFLPPSFDAESTYSGPGARGVPKSHRGLEHYVDDLFDPVLHQGSRTPDMESGWNLTERMKGGGKIGPTQQGVFPSAGYHGMMQVPAYQPVPMMGGMMPAPMPMMPGVGGFAPVPAMVAPQPVVPAVDPNQFAAQQAFINQQALLMAQQMTLQAMTISQQQQRQQRQPSPEPPRPRQTLTPLPAPAPAPAPAAASAPKPKRTNKSKNAAPPAETQEPVADPAEPIHVYLEEQLTDSDEESDPQSSFQQKMEYFQRMGEQKILLKKVKAPSKNLTPPGNPQQEEKEREKPRPEPETAPAPPSPPPTQKQKVKEKKEKEPRPGVAADPAPKREPSREIRNIIKMYQSRPSPEPQPIEPVSKPSKTFLKKIDPRNEALAKLGMASDQPPKSPSPEKSPKGLLPPPTGKKGQPTSSIREKQLPLMHLFGPQPTSPPASPIPPPPPTLSPSLQSADQARQQSELKGSARTLAEEEASIKTQLYKFTASVSFSYASTPWKIFLRKEVFYPKENFSHPYCLNLLCEQIMQDTYSESCIRISKEERSKMKDLLVEFRVGRDTISTLEDGIKKRIVVAARDNWTNYFSRLFPVKGENGSDVQLLGVSHRGLRLLKMAKAASVNPEYLKILGSYSFADVLSVELRGSSSLEFSLRNEQLILHTAKARQVRAMVELFLQELKQDSNYVMALRSYVTDDKSLLSFKKGDLIWLLPMDGLEPGWQFGSVGGRSGLFPSSIVQRAAAPDYISTHVDRPEKLQKMTKRDGLETSREMAGDGRETSDLSTAVSSEISPDTHHYTMQEFATAHFREAQSPMGWKGMSAERNPAVLVEHTKVPIQESLLHCSNSEMNELATKSFMTLMRFMGDQPSLKNQTEMDYIYEILQLCKEKENLHDEVYCQVIKQITQNPKPESCVRGWQLLSLLTGFFLPSTTLMPYATKFLQQASSEPASPYQDLARACYGNLRKMVMYGGRRHLPLRVEMEALLKGRGSRRMVIFLPGALEYVTKIKTFSVAAEVVREICEQMGISELEEIHEFALFASKQGRKVVRPVSREKYVHDYLVEDSSMILDLRRVSWKMPLHFENEIYISIHYSQVQRDYLTGKLWLNDSSDLEKQVGTLALFQHWARGMDSPPTKQELIEYGPDPALQPINPQALQSQVNQLLQTMKPLSHQEAKIQFLEYVTLLPLFGYNVYPVERCSEPRIRPPCIVGVSRDQIIIMLSKTQELCCLIPLKEVQRMRTLGPLDDSGIPGLEVNYGSVDDPKTMWFELHQAKEMYHMITVFMEGRESQP